MKRFTGKRLTQIAALTAALTLAGTAGALDYAPSSSGLEWPAWESGRTELEMADVNLDGNPDLVTIGDHGSPFINTQEHGIAVYFGDGRGGWSVYQNGNFGYGGIAIGDVNGDGLPDAGYAMHHDYSSTDFGDQLIEVALGDGTGQNWTPWDDNLASQGENWGMFATDFGDVDNDGDLDIGSTSFGYGNPLMVYLNDGDGTWTHADAVVTGNCGMHIVFGDINRDGNLDLATAYQNGTVFFGDGTGQFTNADYNLPPGSGSYNRHGVALGDVDGDGGMDLAWVANNALYVHCFDEATNSWVDFSGGLPATSVSGYAQLWDMNSDGFCDVALGGGNQIRIWTGDGAGNWTLAATVPIGVLQAFRVGGDVDHNGFADITYEGGGHPWCFRETTPAQTLSVMPCYPRGGEVFKSGQARFIHWISAVPGFAASTVTVELSTSGASGPWTVVASNRPNDGRHQWTVPAVPTSSDCHLRYSVTSGTSTVQAVTPAPFTILSGPPPIEVTLTPVNPPIQIPAAGGSFEFTATVANTGTAGFSLNAWIMQRVPAGTWQGPLLGPLTLYLPAGANVSRQRFQNVPSTAAPGEYLYCGYVGQYPAAKWDSSYFTYTKEGAGDGGLGAGENWSCTGEPFPGEIGGPSVSRRTMAMPEAFTLSAAPNPFNPVTAIGYQLPASGRVRLRVYDSAGREVAALVEGWRDAGNHEVTFDASGLAGGIYFARLSAGNFTATMKMVLLK
ncbi:MAG: T9SS C-terminal target domain-containing protein [Candidatus Zixiibacteriota bacterium]|nr:MAG: T9SS C-terminal target domain-containing protein [candidate division Zixibacteria bacterium]